MTGPTILSMLTSVRYFLNVRSTTKIYTLSLHDALPICLTGNRPGPRSVAGTHRRSTRARGDCRGADGPVPLQMDRDRKSTRLNSSHANISYAVFCLKKKTH